MWFLFQSQEVELIPNIFLVHSLHWSKKKCEFLGMPAIMCKILLRTTFLSRRNIFFRLFAPVWSSVFTRFKLHYYTSRVVRSWNFELLFWIDILNWNFELKFWIEFFNWNFELIFWLDILNRNFESKFLIEIFNWYFDLIFWIEI